MAEKEEEEQQQSYYYYHLEIPEPNWLAKLLALQSEIIYNCLVTIFSPFLTLSAIASDSYRRAELTASAAESAILAAPRKLTRSTTAMMTKIGLGILGAVHVCVVLTMVMVLSVVLGVGLVRMWAEEPVFSTHKLLFDFTNPNPSAIVHLGNKMPIVGLTTTVIPVGHTFHVSLVLLLPESDYNRQIGVFQLSAEVLTASGEVTARSSRPCMLKFRSLPVRLARTFMMAIPLLLGISDETQKISVELLNQKEAYYPRTGAIRVTLIPRAGTSYLPQLYEAEMVIKSKLPWSKEVVRRWRWTFYVWTSLYIYVSSVIILATCFRPLLFPVPTRRRTGEEAAGGNGGGEWEAEEDTSTSDMVRKWQVRRRKRKASSFLYGETTTTTSVSSMTMSSRDDASSSVVEEEIGDSESVCFSG
ncbi:unnamed protein product [Linum trigynum]|uniref:Seipin n=1 Tax=Linum trigynum TaxID=586398 RepID=A0AAV2CA57_9ROSI